MHKPVNEKPSGEVWVSKPISMQEKICMIYSYLNLCYGLAVLSFLSFFIFVESMKWLGIKACLPFFLSCAIRHEPWIWYSHLSPSPCSCIRKKWISLGNSIHSDNFHSLVKCPKEISRVWVHTEKSCQLSYRVFGFWPSTIQHWNCNSNIYCLAGKIWENNW